MITTTLFAGLTLSASAQEVLLLEDFETDGAGTRYILEGGAALELADHGTPDQSGPIFWARNTEVSIVGVPGPTPARRAILAWDPNLPGDQVSD